ERAVGEADEMRLARHEQLAGGGIDALQAAPLVPALGRDEAARSAPGVPPHRLFRRLLDARVEARPRRLRLRPPVRDQAPAAGGELELAGIGARAQERH